MTVRRIGEWEINDWDGDWGAEAYRGKPGCTVGKESSDVDLTPYPDGLQVRMVVDIGGFDRTIVPQALIPWPVIDELLRHRAALNQEPGK